MLWFQRCWRCVTVEPRREQCYKQVVHFLHQIHWFRQMSCLVSFPCISSNIQVAIFQPASGETALCSWVMDDHGRCPWHFPPGSGRPCHTLLDALLLCVSASYVDSVLDHRKQRETAICLCWTSSGSQEMFLEGDASQIDRWPTDSPTAVCPFPLPVLLLL